MSKLFSERSLEGYLMIDHRESPGLDHPLLGPGSFLEAPTRNCSHCERLVVLNPRRNRERARCRKCFKYLCDGCGTTHKLTGECYSMAQRIDDFVNKAAKQPALILPGGTSA